MQSRPAKTRVLRNQRSVKIESQVGDNDTGGKHRHRGHRDCEHGENSVHKTAGEKGCYLVEQRDRRSEQNS